MAPRLFPSLTASRLHVATYLLGIALFSISFLVFLNSSISFVITDVIGQEEDVGDAFGTLGFADELLALVACPFWGLVSDRIGVRTVAVTGYCIIGLSLICLVQSTNVYPELLLGRLFFSIGGAACSTMVTAVLPAMTAQRTEAHDPDSPQRGAVANGYAARLRDEEHDFGHAPTPSVSSELTITPTRFNSRSRPRRRQEGTPTESEPVEASADGVGSSQLAGFVGMFTGAGALIALAIFLPLPAYFQDAGQSQAGSVQSSFYIVATISFCVAIFIFLGFRRLPGEQDKSLSALFSRPYEESTKTDPEGNLHTTLTPAPSYWVLTKEALKLGFTDSSIGLGYLGGFVARASSVCISGFIPFFVNAYFKRTGLCPPGGGNTLPDIKENCQQAFKLAGALSGIAETAALLCAPLFGLVSGRVAKGHSEWPLTFAAAVGVAGYIAFGLLKQPDPFHGEGGQWAILAAVLVGISQIGCIVCSLGLLGRGTNAVAPVKPKSDRMPTATPASLRGGGDDNDDDIDNLASAPAGAEAAPLLPGVPAHGGSAGERRDRSHLKGSIAGMYSFAGGAGILLLTKLGGSLSDSWSPGAPFFILAIFNALLLVAVPIVSGGAALRSRRTRSRSTQTGDGDRTA